MHTNGKAWWCTPSVLPLGRERYVVCTASFRSVRACLKKKTKKKSSFDQEIKIISQDTEADGSGPEFISVWKVSKDNLTPERLQLLHRHVLISDPQEGKTGPGRVVSSSGSIIPAHSIHFENLKIVLLISHQVLAWMFGFLYFDSIIRSFIIVTKRKIHILSALCLAKNPSASFG